MLLLLLLELGGMRLMVANCWENVDCLSLLLMLLLPLAGLKRIIWATLMNDLLIGVNICLRGPVWHLADQLDRRR